MGKKKKKVCLVRTVSGYFLHMLHSVCRVINNGRSCKVLKRRRLCLKTKASVKEAGHSETWYLLRGATKGPEITKYFSPVQ